MQGTSRLLSLQVLLWLGVVAPDSVLPIVQIELISVKPNSLKLNCFWYSTMCKKKKTVHMLNGILKKITVCEI